MRVRFEKVVAGEERLICVREYWHRATFARYHFHPEIELTAILTGSGRRIVGDHIGPFAEGDLVMFGENLPHQNAGDPGPPHSAGCLVIQFLPEALGLNLLNSTEGAQLRALLEKAKRGLAFPAETTGPAIAKMRALLQTDGTARFILLLEILHLLASLKEAHPLASYSRGQSASQETSRISRACEFIQRQFDQPIRQTDAAAHVALSPSAFSQMFRRATGQNFTSFLSEVRLSEACRLLVETDDTIVQICHRCGFSNLSNFNRRFLASKGVTPREFRRASAQAACS